jgi:hypothetical protein
VATPDGSVGVLWPVGTKVAHRQAVRQLEEARARRRRDGPFQDLGVPLHEHAHVLGVDVVGHVEGHARVLADVRDPGRAL